MPAVQYDRFTEARTHLKELLDAAEQGRPAAVTRHDRSTVLVDRPRFVRHLMALNAGRVELVPDGDAWLAVVADSPISAEGDDAADAIDELIDAMREYAEDWSARLRLAANHEQNWGLVQLVDHSSDDELRAWITGG